MSVGFVPDANAGSRRSPGVLTSSPGSRWECCGSSCQVRFASVPVLVLITTDRLAYTCSSISTTRPCSPPCRRHRYPRPRPCPRPLSPAALVGEENCDLTPIDIKVKVSAVSQDGSRPSLSQEILQTVQQSKPHTGWDHFAPLEVLYQARGGAAWGVCVWALALVRRGCRRGRCHAVGCSLGTAMCGDKSMGQ